MYYNTNVFISLLRLAQVLLNSPLTMGPNLFLEIARILIHLDLFWKCVMVFKTWIFHRFFLVLWTWLKQWYQLEVSKKTWKRSNIFQFEEELFWNRFNWEPTILSNIRIFFQKGFGPIVILLCFAFFVVINGGIWVAFCSAFTVQVQPFPAPSWNYSAS